MDDEEQSDISGNRSGSVTNTRFKHILKSKNRHFTFIIIFISVVLLISAFIVYVIKTNKADKSKSPSTLEYSKICNQDIVNKALELFDYSKISDLESLNSNIKSLNSFEDDPNCLVPIFMQYVIADSLNDAERVLNDIRSLPGFEDRLNGSYSFVGISSIDDLESHLLTMKRRQKEMNENVRFF